MVETFWNGEPCVARRVKAVVADDSTIPDYWAREEGLIGQEIDAVEVVYGGRRFYLDDRDESAWIKVTIWRGSREYDHRELKVARVRVRPVPRFMLAPEVKAVAAKLIEQYHSHLAEARIAYLFRTGAWSAQQRETWGKAQRVTGAQAFLTGKDFVIMIHLDVWNRLTSAEREALVDHELMHCCRGDDDKNGNPTWYIQGHDLEEFHAVVQRHGLWKPDLQRFKKAMDEAKQLTIFDAQVVEFKPTGTEG